jgi:hypothetical protein
MLVATLEQERKKIYQKGEDAGLVKGRIETQHQTIGQLLHFRFELTEAEPGKFAQQVARIQALQHLDELVDTLLNKASKLEDFTRLLTKYLPVDKTE